MIENMNEMLSSIKIRKLILLCIVVTLGVFAISELPGLKSIPDLDANFWLLITNFVFLLWFIMKITIKKISIKPLIDNFKVNIRWMEIFKIVLVNVILSFGFIMCLGFIAYKINPDFMVKLLNQNNEGTNGSFVSTVIGAISASFIAPIIEEFMFRGVIFKRLKMKWGTISAIVVSSLVFALLHYQVAFFGAFFFGVIMCLLYLKTGNILVNICVHFLNNFLMSLINIIAYSPESTSINSNFTSAEVNIVGIAGLAMLIISGFFTIRYIITNYIRIKTQSLELEIH